MSFPGYIGSGLFTIYGIGNNVGISGMTAPEGYKFSTIYNIGEGYTLATEGDSVMYHEKEAVKCRLAYNNGNWGLVELDKIILIEQAPLPPP